MRTLLVLILAVLALVPGAALGCATAPPYDGDVTLVGEEALIVWDSERKVQHFVRRATFATDSKDFGFLVPTPTVPELAEASDEVFTRLAKAVEPKVERRVSYQWEWWLFGTLGAAPAGVMATPGAGVEVLGTARVAGYDAVILAASKPGELAKWLKDHRFSSPPGLEEWLAPYVARGWKLTAFRYSAEKGPEEEQVSGKAVRMSFHADQPFFPYREPKSQARPGESRWMRVFLLSDRRMEGTLGDQEAPWVATVPFSAPLEGPSPLEGVLPEGERPAGARWLNAFVDMSTVRADTGDLYFADAADPREIHPPPRIEWDRRVIPLELVLAAVLGAGVLGLWLAHRKRG